MLKQMTILTTLLVTVLSISSCDNPPRKPQGNIALVNAHPTNEPQPYRLQFNLETDFDENLSLKPDAKGVRVPTTLEDLHANWVMNAATKEELQRYGLEWKQRYIKIKQRLDECESGR